MNPEEIFCANATWSPNNSINETLVASAVKEDSRVSAPISHKMHTRAKVFLLISEADGKSRKYGRD